MRHRLFLVAAMAVALLALTAPAVPAAQPGAAGRWIVTLEDGVARPRGVARGHQLRLGAQVDHVYRHALKGYAADLSAPALAAIRSDPRVARVERDRAVHLEATQTGATWGLDRVDQRSLPLNGSYIHTTSAANVTAYVIDTGIRDTHADLRGRVTHGFDAVDGALPAADCNGHGTHVAGTIGGTTWGVAKGVQLVAVRVLGCGGSGTWSGVIAGIDWVTGHHLAGEAAVANMSLGGGASLAVDTAVANSIADGIVYAVAAGNSTQDACRYSPARTAAAVTVGATTSTDSRASYSNYGSCLDLFAPGSSITSAWSTSDSASATISGTSMASPHVAGAAALVLASNASATPAQVRDALVNASTKNVVKGLTKRMGSTPNRLVYTGP